MGRNAPVLQDFKGAKILSPGGQSASLMTVTDMARPRRSNNWQQPGHFIDRSLKQYSRPEHL